MNGHKLSWQGGIFVRGVLRPKCCSIFFGLKRNTMLSVALVLIAPPFYLLLSSSRIASVLAGQRRDPVYLYADSIRITDPPYNAKCDGKSNDTAAIQAAIDAVSGGGIVNLPAAATCLVSSTLTMHSSGGEIVGAGIGSVLEYTGKSYAIRLVNCFSCQLRQFRLDAPDGSGVDIAQEGNGDSQGNLLQDLVIHGVRREPPLAGSRAVHFAAGPVPHFNYFNSVTHCYLSFFEILVEVDRGENNAQRFIDNTYNAYSEEGLRLRGTEHEVLGGFFNSALAQSCCSIAVHVVTDSGRGTAARFSMVTGANLDMVIGIVAEPGRNSRTWVIDKGSNSNLIMCGDNSPDSSLDKDGRNTIILQNRAFIQNLKNAP